MGSSRFNPKAYTAYATSTSSKSHRDYSTSAAKPEFLPADIKVRESFSSAANPHPTPVIVALDVSGSMGMVVEAMRKGLGVLFEQVIQRDPVSDPHVLAMAVGDFDFDKYPCQATQFEADPVTIGKQIEELCLEGGGGGNAHESYLGPLYFAAMRTDCVAMKEGRKGFLFTVGDEEPQMVLERAHVKKFFGDSIEKDMTAAELVALVERNGWHYFHLIVEEGSHARSYKETVTNAWRDVLGQRAISLSKHNKMAEVIISILEIVSGRDKDEIVKSWDGSTALVVRKAIADLPAGVAATGTSPVSL